MSLDSLHTFRLDDIRKRRRLRDNAFGFPDTSCTRPVQSNEGVHNHIRPGCNHTWQCDDRLDKATLVSNGNAVAAASCLVTESRVKVD